MRTLDVNGVGVDYWVYWLPGTTSELLFGSRAGAGDATVADIFSIQADGSGLTPVVPSKMGPAEYMGVDLAPDGRTLTYWRWESATLPGRIHQLDIATKVDRELRFDPSAYGEAGLLHSPDGSQVLLSRNERPGPSRAVHDRSGRRQPPGHPYRSPVRCGRRSGPDMASRRMARRSSSRTPVKDRDSSTPRPGRPAPVPRQRRNAAAGSAWRPDLTTPHSCGRLACPAGRPSHRGSSISGPIDYGGTGTDGGSTRGRVGLTERGPRRTTGRVRHLRRSRGETVLVRAPNTS